MDVTYTQWVTFDMERKWNCEAMDGNAKHSDWGNPEPEKQMSKVLSYLLNPFLVFTYEYIVIARNEKETLQGSAEK